ncbi:RluA family pseudouridine synthase [Neobacillus drentensis]|uniref:RluA family pseudouridine synthase n=1 Tax=Neobacillus drentensis TaxID=220684 RepID=UPI00285A968A|nr:RluA family pseudouridine synthase [Neobacillus drentensis]MDR7238910.1 23S rRNA pseudouridine1911/1915/1917 synthase [Neobacillus drentensis]
MLKTTRMGDWFQLTIPFEWNGKTVADIFRNVWEAPKKVTHSFRMDNKVLVNGDSANWNTPLSKGSKLQLNLFGEEELQITPNYLNVDILYEDDHVIVLNKPPFMNTHPNDPKADINTLVNAVQYYMQANGEIRNIRQVHRLDRDTSGAILFAKHALAGAILDNMLEKREIKRTYVALVHGMVKQSKGTIRAAIGRDRHHATKRRVSPTGQDALTHYMVLKVDKAKQMSFVKCWLDTGRTHQIRVHLSYLGHPLVGDILYGGSPVVKRQALHAAKLEFIHPFTQERIICHAPFLDQPIIFKDIDIYSL